MKFNPGDRVELIMVAPDGGPVLFSRGIVRRDPFPDLNYGGILVQWNGFHDGHTYNRNSGWNVPPSCLKKLKRTIVDRYKARKRARKRKAVKRG